MLTRCSQKYPVTSLWSWLEIMMRWMLFRWIDEFGTIVCEGILPDTLQGN